MSNFVHNGAHSLSYEEICSRHVPPDHFRVSQQHFELGTEFSGSSRPGWLYVLAGSCEFSSSEDALVLQSGEWAEQKESLNFHFKVIGDSKVHLVRVWPLPESVWPA